MNDKTIEPTLDLPLSAAVEELTGFEVIAIQKHFGTDMAELGAARLVIGVVWVYENRDGRKRDWASVKAMTLRELNGYFQPEPQEAVEDEPRTDVGKG